MNRRTVLTAALSAPAVALAGSLPVVAAVETPVMALYRQWLVAFEREESLYGFGVDESVTDAACLVRCNVTDALMAEPCRNAHDWMLKVCAWSYHGEAGGPDRNEAPQLWAEARALVA